MSPCPTSTRSLRSARFAAVIAVALFGATLAARPASADPSDHPAKKAAPVTPGHDPNNVTGISDAMVEIVAGNDAYVAKDLSGAMEHYKKAIELQPKNALAYYMLGAAQLASGSADDAEATWKKGEAIADPVPDVKSRILFAEADLKERQRKWTEARDAWQKFADYVAKREVGYPDSGTARLKALDLAIKQDQAYEVVRKRIADEREAAAKAPVKPSTPAKK